MAPEFSVIVPVYNAEPYLRQCLDSILGQSFGGFELLLTDDGSPDGSGAICDEYAEKDSRVQVIHQPNRGVTAARRAALDRARGDYVCFVDGDDWVEADWLQTIRRCLEENGWPDMLLFGLKELWDNGSRPETEIPPRLAAGRYDRSRLEREVWPYMIWDRRCPFLTQLFPGYMCTKVIRRPLALAHYVQNTAITVYEDVAMVYECLYNAAALAVCPDILYTYRQHSGSALARFAPNTIDNIKLCRDYMLDHLVRQAPALGVQVDAFFADKLIRILRFSRGYHFTVRQTARILADGLDRTGLAGPLSRAALPLHIRLFMLLLRCRLYYPAAALYRAFLWVCTQARSLRSGGG